MKRISLKSAALLAAAFAMEVACSSGSGTTSSSSAANCVATDASVNPITLGGLNPWSIAPTSDGTRVLVAVAGAPDASSGGLSANETDAGIFAFSASTKAALGVAPAETASVSGDAGSKVTVGWYSAIAVLSATKAYAVANSSAFNGSAIYKFDPSTGGNVTAITLSAGRNACSIGELAIDFDGGRLFGACAGSPAGVITVDTTTDTENSSAFISTPKTPQSVAVFPADGGTLLIATTDYTIGSLGRVSLGPTLGTLSIATSTLGPDPVVRVLPSGTTTHAIVLNRNGASGGTGTNSVQFLDPANNFETAKISGSTNDKNFSTGQGSNPVDAVAGSSGEIWVSLLNVSSGGLIAMNTTSGAITTTINLASLASPGNLPRANAMAIVGDRIWVTLQNSSSSFMNYGAGKIVILNPAAACLESAP